MLNCLLLYACDSLQSNGLSCEVMTILGKPDGIHWMFDGRQFTVVHSFQKK